MINKLSWIARRTKRRLNIEDNFLLQSMGIAIVRKRKTIKWVILLVLIFDPSLSRLSDRNKSLNYSNLIFIGRQGFKIDRAWCCLWWIQNERNFDPLQKRVINIVKSFIFYCYLWCLQLIPILQYRFVKCLQKTMKCFLWYFVFLKKHPRKCDS